MKRNKSKIVIALALCLCMLLALCGCDSQKDPGQGTTAPATPSTGPAAPSAEVPTEDGKVTFYFTLGDTSVEQPSIASYYLTGGSFDWKTGLDALTFTNLEGTKTYYAITDVIPDPAKDKGLDYQLKVGYNATSGAPESELGLTWSDDELKSDVCNIGGESNPQFTYEAGAKTVNLGVHNFLKAIPLPQTADTTLVVTFKEPLPEGAEARIYGGFNGWKADDDAACKFTLNAERTKGELKLNGVLLNTYTYKVVVYGPGQYKGTEDQWKGTTYVENADADGNGVLIIGSLDDGDYIEVVTDIEFKQTEGISTTLSVTFDKALDAGSIVHIYGSFQGWGYAEGKCEMTSEDNKVWNFTIDSVNPGKVEFKVLVYAPGTTEFGWGKGVEYAGEGGANCAVELTAESAGQVIPAATFTVQ